jgi:non-ribosomal peptide synthetase component E (peptide arylation enzyme)
VRNLMFNGRVKDMIDRGGEKINRGEVELVIGQHPSVAAAACLAMPDSLYGEKMCAFTVLEAGAAAIVFDYLTRNLGEKGLAKFKCPERIELVEELPMTTSGKVSKPLMREIIAAKLKAESAAA